MCLIHNTATKRYFWHYRAIVYGDEPIPVSSSRAFLSSNGDGPLQPRDVLIGETDAPAEPKAIRQACFVFPALDQSLAMAPTDLEGLGRLVDGVCAAPNRYQG